MGLKRYLNRIINEDCLKALSKIDKDSIDLVVTSPPYDDLRDYNKESTWTFETFKKVARKLFRVVKEGGVVVWVVGDKVENGNKSLTSFKQALYFQSVGFNVYDVLIYEKTGSGPPHSRRYFNTFEYMVVLSKGLPKTVNLLRDKENKWAGVTTYSDVTRREKDGSLTNKGRKVVNQFGVRTNIWKYNNGNGFTTKDEIAYRHPAIFPEKLAEDHILAWSNPGDVVLDPFGGSGTVAKKAIEHGRQWISIEISAAYCEIAKQRLNLKEGETGKECTTIQ